MDNNAPIGILDSGIGGLTIARAIQQLLPNESLVYVGDTANLPYGDKSPAVINDRVWYIVDFLLKQRVKLIVVACSTATAASGEQLAKYLKNKVPLINVVDPLVEYLTANDQYSKQKLGLIGTTYTVNSNIYQQKLAKQEKQFELYSLATPLLVPAIEAGFLTDNFEEQIALAIKHSFENGFLTGIETLILGCTHYPIIKSQLAGFYANRIEVVDSSEATAGSVSKTLVADQLLATKSATNTFYATANPQLFSRKADLFLTGKIKTKLLTFD